MKLAKRIANPLALVAIALFVAGTAGAQGGKPAKGHAHRPKKAAKAAPAAQAPGTSPAGTPVAENGEGTVARRDPFVPLVNIGKTGNEHLPPGKAGLVIATVRVDGAVSSPDGMIAVVSNPEEHVYFIREGDHLYDGEVEKIGLDGVTFRENSKDAFGKPVERTVTKRIFASAGEPQ